MLYVFDVVAGLVAADPPLAEIAEADEWIGNPSVRHFAGISLKPGVQIKSFPKLFLSFTKLFLKTSKMALIRVVPLLNRMGIQGLSVRRFSFLQDFRRS